MKIGKDYLVGNNVNYSRINEVEQSLLVEKFPQFINTLKNIISKSGLFNKPYNEKEYYQSKIELINCQCCNHEIKKYSLLRHQKNKYCLAIKNKVI